MKTLDNQITLIIRCISEVLKDANHANSFVTEGSENVQALLRLYYFTVPKGNFLFQSFAMFQSRAEISTDLALTDCIQSLARAKPVALLKSLLDVLGFSLKKLNTIREEMELIMSAYSQAKKGSAFPALGCILDAVPNFRTG